MTGVAQESLIPKPASDNRGRLKNPLRRVSLALADNSRSSTGSAVRGRALLLPSAGSGPIYGNRGIGTARWTYQGGLTLLYTEAYLSKAKPFVC